jgi:hypothetical protein
VRAHTHSQTHKKKHLDIALLEGVGIRIGKINKKKNKIKIKQP